MGLPYRILHTTTDIYIYIHTYIYTYIYIYIYPKERWILALFVRRAPLRQVRRGATAGTGPTAVWRSYLWTWGFGYTHRLHSSAVLGLPYRILNMGIYLGVHG